MRNDLKYSLESFLRERFEEGFKTHSDKFVIFIHIADLNFYKDQLFDQINVSIKENLLGKILIQELAIAKKAEILIGETTEERFLSFIEITNNVEWVDYLKSKYKFLIKKINNYINAIIDFSFEILSNFKQDYNHILNNFNLSNADQISFIEISKSDLHNNNKSVAFLHLNSNKIILYKPKSLDLEVWFNEFITWIADELKYPIKRKLPIMYCGKDYGWVEEIIHEISSNESDILSYYFTLGQYTAIFYTLNSYDIINDNIICVNDTPVFIDLETLLFKKRRKLYRDRENILANSVTRLGILPNANNIGLQGTHDFDGAMIQRPQNFTLKFWANKGQDNMHQVLKNVEISNSDFKHLPFDPLLQSFQIKYKESFVSGFENCYQKIFIDKKTELLNNSVLNKLKDLKVRVLMRDTSNYSKLLDESTHPDVLKTQKAFNNHLSILKELPKKKYLSSRIIKEEIKQLKDFNIPYFYSYIGSKSLYSNNEIIVEDYFEGQDIKQSVKSFAEKNRKDLNFEKSLIIQKLDFYFDQETHNEKLSKEIFNFSKYSKNGFGLFPPNNEHLLSAAEKLGNLIIERSIISNDTIDFIFKGASGIENVYNINLAQFELYQGKTGISMFLLYLYKYTNNNKYLNYADKIFRSYIKSLKRDLQNNKRYLDPNIPFNPYFYPLDALYLSCHFAHILKDQSYYSETYALIERSLNLTLNSKVNDFLTGRSGVLFFLCELISFDSSLTPLVHEIKDKIISEKQVPEENQIAWGSSNIRNFLTGSEIFLGGFSHGVSGIATSLAKYNKIFNKESLASESTIDIICKALTYEDSLYSPNTFRWKDLRYGLDDSIVSTYWCHGSAGVVLGRLLIYEYLGDKLPERLKIDKESLNAVGEDILRNSLHKNYGICHGDMGNLEILKILNSFLGNKENLNSIQSIIDKYAINILNNTNNLNFPSYEPLGLFNGISGIGYTLLRFYNWQETPSLLCLETPFFKNKILH